MIQVENLTRNYGDFKAVADVTFSIRKGEVVGLLGHNGAGKSTIMKMLTGYLEPTSGSITIDGLQIRSERENIQKKIGYLPENCPVYPDMTILAYLDYCTALHGVADNNRAAWIRDAVEKTALAAKAGDMIATLSRGYRQRVGVAQAILHKPDILILDEPTNGLDPTQIQQMRGLIRELAATTTVIVSTHILQEVQAVCDRVLIIKNGRLALDSSLAQLKREGRLCLSLDASGNDAEQLFKAVPAVKKITSMGCSQAKSRHNEFALTVDEDADKAAAAAEIAKRVVERGWNLYSMHYEERNLETVFAEISA